MEKNQEFKKVYESHVSEIYRFCMFKLNNKEESEDVTSEAFIKLYEQNIGEINNVRAWLYKVARNTIYDNFVRPTTKNLVEFSDLDTNEEKIMNSLKSIEKEAIEESSIEIIKTEISGLDDITADIITMKIWGEMKFSEIAEATDLKENAVKMRFYRGVEELQRRVQSKDQKLRSLTIPAVMAGILALSTQPAYAMGTAQGAAISASVGSTLGVTLSTMIGSSLTGSAAGASVASVAGGGLLATTTAKIIAGSSILLASAGIGIGAVAISNNDAPNTPSPITQNEEQNDFKAFNSSEYNISFEFPEDYGNVQTNLNEDYFNVESVTFSNSELSISYPHFEGGIGSDIDTESMNSKNGVRFNIHTFSQGVNGNLFGIVAQNSSGVNNTVTFMVQELETLKDVEDYKSDIKEILETLVFDFESNLNTYNSILMIFEDSEIPFNETSQSGNKVIELDIDEGKKTIDGEALALGRDEISSQVESYLVDSGWTKGELTVEGNTLTFVDFTKNEEVISVSSYASVGSPFYSVTFGKSSSNQSSDVMVGGDYYIANNSIDSKIDVNLYQGRAILTHQHDYTHSDVCDFEGVNGPDQLNVFTDFSANLTFDPRTIEEIFQSEYSYYYDSGFILDENTIDTANTHFNDVSFNNLTGFSSMEGVEGCGYNLYLFPVEGGTIVVRQKIITELLFLTQEFITEYENIPGVILPSEADQIFNQIMNGVYKG
jgi:RNA polymerase sigma-70 factor (ECF subfamily)